jgi:hypothetical protein
MNVIAFSGQLANGKDESADYLATLMAPDWQRGAFANAVKDTFCDAFGVTREFIEKWKRNPEPPPGFKVTVRKGLQNIGDGFREIVEDIWIQIALRDKSKKQIISDGRYINEAKAVFDGGGVNILVYRPGYLNDDPNPSESQIRPIVEWFRDNHPEGEVKNIKNAPYGCQFYHYFLINDGNLDDLKNKIEYALFPYLNKPLGP